jgi:hypothetical protein
MMRDPVSELYDHGWMDGWGGLAVEPNAGGSKKPQEMYSDA